MSYVLDDAEKTWHRDIWKKWERLHSKTVQKQKIGAKYYLRKDSEHVFFKRMEFNSTRLLQAPI